ncbi:hypothetical protein [Streptomyces broussonetiae]|uniref:Integral membrane protein n=1 Tax=Streptomyces broussonetiae TaxID=2686304 RepID=A0ABV5E5W3_9ACTN
MSPPGRLRNALSAALTALACLLAPFGALAAWAAYGLADTGRYVRAMAPLSSDPAVREAVADTVGDGLEQRVDLGAMTPYVRSAVRSFTHTEAYRAGWDAANRATHDAVLRALRDGHGDGRPVTVDLAPVADRVKRQLAEENVPLAHRVPVEHTRVAVLPATAVDRLRKGYDMLEVAAFWLPLTAVGLAVAGIAVAARRHRALTAAGLGTALGGALLGVAVAIGRHLTVAGVPDDLHRPAAGAVYDALTATLRTASWLLCGLGLAVALAAWLTRFDRIRNLPRRPRGRRASPAPGPVPPPAPTRARA